MAFCPTCGAAVEGKFCAKCGSPVAAAPVSDPAGVKLDTTPVSLPGLTDNLVAVLCYLLFMAGPLVFLLVPPYNQKRAIRFHAFQAIFFHAAAVVIGLVWTTFASVASGVFLIGWLVGLSSFVIWLAFLMTWLILMYKAYNNDRLVLPIIGPLAEKQA